jgi:hypothetical protein
MVAPVRHLRIGGSSVSQVQTASFVETLPPAIRDRFEALDFVERRLPNQPNLRDYYADFRDDLRECIQRGEKLPAEPDLPAWSSGESPAQKSYRYLAFLIRQLHEHGEEGRLPLVMVHAKMNEARQQLNGLRRKLLDDGLVLPAEGTPAQSTFDVPVEAIPMQSSDYTGQPALQVKAPEPPTPRRSVLEVLTDPHSIQWFLAVGGGLFVVGLVLLLWSLNVFQYPIVTASFLGAGTLALVFGGWAVLARTRYQLAGRALTLLGCLVLPLNFWYYHASGLLIEHLWVPALVGCAIYAASALRLRDPLFVPVLVAGVTLTGLLMLSDAGKFAEIAGPATFLVGFALLCIHAERAFAEGDGPFSRGKFGLAFFWSGHVVLLAGLGLLLGGQLLGLYARFVHAAPALVPAITTDPTLKILALALVLAATYLYLYSDFVVRHLGVYTVLAALTLLWAEVLLLDVLGLNLSLETLITALAGTGLFVNLVQAAWRGEETHLRGMPLPVLGLLLNLAAVGLAIVLHGWAVGEPERITWVTIGALALTALSSRIGAALAAGKSNIREWTYFLAAAAATLMAVAEGLVLLHVTPWAAQAAWLMLLPIAYVVAARLYHGHSAETPLVWCGHIAVPVIALSGGVAAALWPTATLANPGLLAILCAEAMVFYTLNALWRERAFNVYLATLSAVGAISFTLMHLNIHHTEAYTLAVAGAGLVLLVAYRLALIESYQPRLSTAVFQCANVLVSLAVIAGFLQVVNRLSEPTGVRVIAWNDAGYLGVLATSALLAALLVVETGWRRWYIVAAIATGLLAGVVAFQLLDLPPWRVAELVAVVLGLLLLIASLIGWLREGEMPGEHIGFGLALGSLLLTIPLAVAVGEYRFGYTVSTGDEIAFVTAGLALFGMGFILKLRAPTLIGATAFVGYLVMLIVYAHRFLNEMWIIGIYLAVGGLLLFGIGLVLSVYRDWLLTLPDRIRKREGVWKVLNWR